jgi:molybdate transport system substrate-binding protein
METRSLPFHSLVLACSITSPGCSGEAGATARPSVEILVYAATSTRDVLQRLEAPYERAHGVDLVFNFGSSGDLSNQIVAAARADVFLSADEKEMDELEQAELLAPGTRRALLSNQLVVVESADGPSLFRVPFSASQLAGPAIQRLSLADVEAVPAGRYAKAWLEKEGTWSAVSERVLPGVDVRAALAAVESGGAQAGIVYRTDVAARKTVRVVFAVPIERGPRISYPVASIAGRPAEEEARALVQFLGSPAAGKAFEEFGFVFLPDATVGRK